MTTPPRSTRRALLRSAAALGIAVSVRPSTAASSETLQAAVRRFADGAAVREGKVTLDIAPLVENGNTVPITVSVDSPMTAQDHVAAVAVFNEKNPERNVAVFHLGPRCGRAVVSTRIRLATSQKLVAVARMSDGSHWSGTADVVVTLAGCVEGS
jgi:sulfur-oxidizing protein SoxY